VSLVPRGHDGVNGNAMVWSGTAWYDAGTGVNLPVGEWSHVAFVNDRGTLSVYVDGVLAFEGTGFPNVFTTENGVFTLGVNWWDTAFKGSIDELTVWTSALTAQDVAQLGAR
jgi:arabinan endo-1,5-alpha-L-arabinosidase